MFALRGSSKKLPAAGAFTRFETRGSPPYGIVIISCPKIYKLPLAFFYFIMI